VAGLLKWLRQVELEPFNVCIVASQHRIMVKRGHPLDREDHGLS
jgi:hypothetical protein